MQQIEDPKIQTRATKTFTPEEITQIRDVRMALSDTIRRLLATGYSKDVLCEAIVMWIKDDVQ